MAGMVAFNEYLLRTIIDQVDLFNLQTSSGLARMPIRMLLTMHSGQHETVKTL